MYSNGVKWLVGSLAFFLPAAVAAVGTRLDKSRFRHDATYAALIPLVCLGTIFVALSIPTVMVLRSRMSLVRRMGLAGLIWCLLLLETYWIFVAVVSGH